MARNCEADPSPSVVCRISTSILRSVGVRVLTSRWPLVSCRLVSEGEGEGEGPGLGVAAARQAKSHGSAGQPVIRVRQQQRHRQSARPARRVRRCAAVCTMRGARQRATACERGTHARQRGTHARERRTHVRQRGTHAQRTTHTNQDQRAHHHLLHHLSPSALLSLHLSLFLW